jgi:hypothetical protein
MRGAHAILVPVQRLIEGILIAAKNALKYSEKGPSQSLEPALYDTFQFVGFASSIVGDPAPNPTSFFLANIIDAKQKYHDCNSSIT